ncbi:MAG: histidine--tRNA ligase [Eggerthellaceae bacterium]|nr:histidine--tRNA ligase [Eggerthellaceae bacterium]
MTINAPEGTFDMLPDRKLFWETFKETARKVFGRYGYLSIETPVIERTELFVRGIGEATDVVSKEMFTAISGANLEKLLAGEKVPAKSRLSLRPEGTAGVVRAVVQHDLVPQGAPPAKLMYAGQMFRAERPQRDRQREFNQVGIECLGSEDPTIDAEAIVMLMRFFGEVGIPRESMTLLVNSMGCDSCRPAYRDAVRGYMEEHVDELCDTCRARMEMNPLRAFDCKNPQCAEVMDGAPKMVDHLCEDCKDHYANVLALLKLAGLAYTEDPKLVRGLDYYTRTVFEVQVAGSDKAQNAIGGGGRYDKLAEEVGGRPTPGFGFALGFERCANLLEDLGHVFPKASACKIFVASVNDDVRNDAFVLTQILRDAGAQAECDHQGRSLKSQFKLADKLGARAVAILGPDELRDGFVRVRDMSSHEERLVPQNDAAAALMEIAS